MGMKSTEKMAMSHRALLLVITVSGLSMGGCQALKEGMASVRKRAGTRSFTKSVPAVEKKDPVAEEGKGYLSKRVPGGPLAASGGGEDASLEIRLRRRIRDLESELKEAKSDRARALDEVKDIKGTYGKRVFELENSTERLQGEKEKYKNEAVQAQLVALKAGQNLDRIKLEVMRQKTRLDRDYPTYYAVVRGDSLWRIAGRASIYNDSYKWPELYYANRDKLESKDRLFPGQVLLIPRYYESLLAGIPRDLTTEESPGVILNQKGVEGASDTSELGVSREDEDIF